MEFIQSQQVPKWNSEITTPKNAEVITETAPLGINPESAFAQTVPVIDHKDTNILQSIFTTYNEERKNNIRLGDTKKKACAAFDVMQKTQSVLIEIEPWFINKKMGDDQYDRWEPFCLGFPEVAIDRQLKVTNVAPLSEVTYQIEKRDSFLQKAQNTDEKVNTRITHPAVKAQIAEQKAFTRHTLDACYKGEDENSLWIDKTITEAIHTHLTPWPHHLILTTDSNDELHCGRGPLFDEHISIAIDVDRRKNPQGERKVAVYNDTETKDVMNSLTFDEVHHRYYPQKARWEIDLSSLETFIQQTLTAENIDYISIHRSTEKAYMTHINPQFRNKIHGYPGF